MAKNCNEFAALIGIYAAITGSCPIVILLAKHWLILELLEISLLIDLINCGENECDRQFAQRKF